MMRHTGILGVDDELVVLLRDSLDQTSSRCLNSGRVSDFAVEDTDLEG